MSDRLLVSGFDRFGFTKEPNSSSEVALPAIKQKYGDLVEALVLPTAHDVAAAKLLEAIREISPLGIVMFGISSRSSISLEQRAINERFSLLTPDNNGVCVFDKVDPQGASRYSSTLPLDALYTRLHAANVPVEVSMDAGTFVCNEVMYRALRHTENQATPTGFIHLGNRLSDRLVEEAAVLVVDELVGLTVGATTTHD